MPLNYYRSSVSGYVSLTGFASLPLFRRGRIRSQQQSDIPFGTSLEACRLQERLVLRSSSFNEVIDASRDDSDDPMASEMRHRQYRQFLQVPRNKSKTPPQRDILHAINGDDSLPTAAINYLLAEEMQLRPRCPSTR